MQQQLTRDANIFPVLLQLTIAIATYLEMADLYAFIWPTVSFKFLRKNINCQKENNPVSVPSGKWARHLRSTNLPLLRFKESTAANDAVQ